MSVNFPLKTDYVDDVLNTDVNTNRKFRMINNGDGTVSFEDVTEYLVEGDGYGKNQVNEQNEAINELNNDLATKKDIKILGSQTDANVGANSTLYDSIGMGTQLATLLSQGYSIINVLLESNNEGYPTLGKVNTSNNHVYYSVFNHSSSSVRITTTAKITLIK